MANDKTPYHLLPFHERRKRLGDDAEKAFEVWAKNRNISIFSWGFHRPPFKRFFLMPAVLRLTPDFVCEQKVGKDFIHYFDDCKGATRDHVKIKDESLSAMCNHVDFFGCEGFFFIYRDTKNMAALVHLEKIVELLEDRPTSYFNDGGKQKPYRTLPLGRLTWEDV